MWTTRNGGVMKRRGFFSLVLGVTIAPALTVIQKAKETFRAYILPNGDIFFGDDREHISWKDNVFRIRGTLLTKNGGTHEQKNQIYRIRR